VTVVVDDNSGKGVFTDIEGHFKLILPQMPQSLTFRYVGYRTQRIGRAALAAYEGKTLPVTLERVAYDLPEAVVRAGENPAHRLIRNAIAYRHRNNPERRGNYTCNTYNKVIFDMVPVRSAFEEVMSKRDTSKKMVREEKMAFEMIEKSVVERHLFMTESVTERIFMPPNIVRERVLLNRVSGVDGAGLVALANQVQPFSFYGDYLRFLDRDYVNPISPGSTDRYFFNIEDTIVSGADTTWVIAFRPRKNKVFEALEGVLHLCSKGWAMQSVQAEPSGPPRNIRLKIEQGYQLVEAAKGKSDTTWQWFPSQLNFEISIPSEPYLSLAASGRSFISHVTLGQKVKMGRFDSEMPLLIEDNAFTKADSAWGKWRSEGLLSKKEGRTYQFMDSIGQELKLDQVVKAMDYLITGRIPLWKNAPVNVEINHLLRINRYEGLRLGFGISNAQERALRRQKTLEWGANAAYGFGDKAFKYGGYGLWRIYRGWDTRLRLGYRRDIVEPGAVYELNTTSFTNRSFYAQRMDYTNEWSGMFSSRLSRFFYGALTFRQESRTTGNYTYAFGLPDRPVRDRFRFVEATAWLRFAFGEEQESVLGRNVVQNLRVPAFEVAYTRSLPNRFGGNYQYTRVVAALYQNMTTKRFGRTLWRIEAGMVTPQVPFARLFSTNQPVGGGVTTFAIANTFQTLSNTLFLSDQFVHLFFSQQLGPGLYKRKYSSPMFSVLCNAGWGQMSSAQRRLIQELDFNVLDQKHIEAGLQIDNILLLDYANIAKIGFGVATYYRIGQLQSDVWWRNIIPRPVVRFNF
jgi:Family of unknown function (DUF5686)